MKVSDSPEAKFTTNLEINPWFLSCSFFLSSSLPSFLSPFLPRSLPPSIFVCYIFLEDKGIRYTCMVPTGVLIMVLFLDYSFEGRV